MALIKFSFPDRDNQVRGMVLDCHTADHSMQPWLQPLSLGISSLILQNPAAFLPFNLTVKPLSPQQDSVVSFIDASAAAVCLGNLTCTAVQSTLAVQNQFFG